VRLTVSVLLASAWLGCAGSGHVDRVVDGRIITGQFVAPEAYAAFLRGAIAEERGELNEALVAYGDAAARGDDDPEIWTRIGAVRCAANPHDPAAHVAFERALSADAEYAGAWAARARCALDRGEPLAALPDARRAADAEPLAVEPQVLLAQAEAAEEHAHAARDRLLALTELEGSRVTAWDALAAWARAHGDAALAVRAWAQVGRLAPGRRAELGGRVIELAGAGELSAARVLAAALLDAPGDRSSGGTGPSPDASPLVARLAIDEALVRHDPDRARSRAARAHLGLDVVAGRALIMGQPGLVRAIALPVAQADSRAAGARIVLAVAAEEQGDLEQVSRALALAPYAADPLAPEVVLPLARLVARIASTASARKLVEEVPRAPLLAGDVVLTSLAVELAASGTLSDADLPLDARIELAARRLEAPALGSLDAVDARHRLFALSLARPLDPAVLELARHLAPAAIHDPLIAVAFVRLSLARSAQVDVRALERLVAQNPADPIVAAAVLDALKRRGDEHAIAPARARLTALARTPGERAHALE
jgi:hypothetical protein